MKSVKDLTVFFLTLWCVLSLVHCVLADVAPGDRIDTTNADKLQGLVPEPVLNWVKKGDFVVDIAVLKYNPQEFFTSHQLESFKTNAGKYDLDNKDSIIEVKTASRPDTIIGLPFPKIDPSDPKAAQKIMYNNHYMQYQLGNVALPFYGISVNRNGLEREGLCDLIQMPMDGYPGAKGIPNPDRVEKYTIVVARSPFDVAGTAVMLCRYLDADKQDSTFGYIPAIRRVRRMSPANRSDSFLGSDFGMDDTNGYDGKISAFEWKVVAMQESLAPFLGTEPALLEPKEKGKWVTSRNISSVLYGYKKEGWTGAPWAPTNLVWVKRPMYRIEMRPKDPYYNYGLHHVWIDADSYLCNYKVIHDKSGKYWKTVLLSGRAFKSADGKMRVMGLGDQQAIDDRADHASIIEDASPRNVWVIFADLDLNDFSLAGFQKYCK